MVVSRRWMQLELRRWSLSQLDTTFTWTTQHPWPACDGQASTRQHHKSMKTILPVLSLVVLSLVWSCGEKKQDNQALYDEVMKVHDEVMPKMDDIYKLKQELKKQISDKPDLVDEKRRTIEATILKLDSASEAMMVWMRNFNPLPDSLGEEKAREYLEDQQEKIENVKEEMLDAINKATELN